MKTSLTLTEALALPGVYEATKTSAAFWSEKRKQAPNALHRQVIDRQLKKLRNQAQNEHTAYLAKPRHQRS